MKDSRMERWDIDDDTFVDKYKKFITKGSKNRKVSKFAIKMLIWLMFVIVILTIISLILTIDFTRLEYPKEEKIAIKEVEKVEPKAIEPKEAKPEVEEEKIEEKVDNGPFDYRLTSFYPGDPNNSTEVTASGKKISEFQLNDKGWYTYEDKLVVATASKRLLSWDVYSNSKSRMYELYDELILEINGEKYTAIVLDVCGAAMQKDIIDLFVRDKESVIDTKIKVYLPE